MKKSIEEKTKNGDILLLKNQTIRTEKSIIKKDKKDIMM
jgi:hypothetical protein